MLQNAYFLAKIGADTAEIELNFAEMLPVSAGMGGRGSRTAASGGRGHGSCGAAGRVRVFSASSAWREERHLGLGIHEQADLAELGMFDCTVKNEASK